MAPGPVWLGGPCHGTGIGISASSMGLGCPLCLLFCPAIDFLVVSFLGHSLLDSGHSEPLWPPLHLWEEGTFNTAGVKAALGDK